MVMGYHSHNSFLAALNNTLVFSHNSDLQLLCSLSLTTISNTNAVRSSLAEPTEIILLGATFLMCANVGPSLTEEKEKGTAPEDMVVSQSGGDKA